MDLLLASIALFTISAVCFVAATQLTRRSPGWISSGLAVCTLALMVAFAATIYGDLALARVLPFSGAIVLGNWLPVGAAVLMGVVVAQRKVPFWRKVAIASMLGTLASYTIVYDVLSPPPMVAKPRFMDGFCAQTNTTSCSACSGAALLLHHEIDTSEREMVDLCLTRKDGTPELGLYRGLKLKTQGTNWTVQPLPSDLDEIRRRDMLPAILFVEVGNAMDRGQWWRPRCTTHSVVVFGFTDNGAAVVGDPSCGMKRWKLEELKEHWERKGLWLEPREGAGL